MTINIEEVQHFNYAIDASGIGIKQFEFNEDELTEIIYTDLQNFPEINYLKVKAEVTDNLQCATTLKTKTRLLIRIFMKIDRNTKEFADSMNLIIKYLRKTFIE